MGRKVKLSSGARYASFNLSEDCIESVTKVHDLLAVEGGKFVSRSGTVRACIAMVERMLAHASADYRRNAIEQLIAAERTVK
jgi:hypothetical protein